MQINRHLRTLLAVVFVLFGHEQRHGCAQDINNKTPGYLTSKEFAIEGLPQQQYHLNAAFKGGRLERVNIVGTVGYIIKPTGTIDSHRRWIWIAPLWLALNSAHGNQTALHYTESALKAGFHVLGVDVGTSLGSPKASQIMQQFHSHCVTTYNLSTKARMLAVSNGGLIVYGYASRYPKNVERILAIYPAVDFRTWPGLKLVAGAGAFTPTGLGYDLTLEEMKQSMKDFNPIDNLAPIARAKIPALHLHGDADKLVPIINSTEAAKRFKDAGGNLSLKVLPGRGHGGKEFFNDADATQFLLSGS